MIEIDFCLKSDPAEKSLQANGRSYLQSVFVLWEYYPEVFAFAWSTFLEISFRKHISEDQKMADGLILLLNGVYFCVIAVHVNIAIGKESASALSCIVLIGILAIWRTKAGLHSCSWETETWLMYCKLVRLQNQLAV